MPAKELKPELPFMELKAELRVKTGIIFFNNQGKNMENNICAFPLAPYRVIIAKV